VIYLQAVHIEQRLLTVYGHINFHKQGRQILPKSPTGHGEELFCHENWEDQMDPLGHSRLVCYVVKCVQFCCTVKGHNSPSCVQEMKARDICHGETTGQASQVLRK
jgi:hypothetical protein